MYSEFLNIKCAYLANEIPVCLQSYITNHIYCKMLGKLMEGAWFWNAPTCRPSPVVSCRHGCEGPLAHPGPSGGGAHSGGSGWTEAGRGLERMGV